MNRINVICLGVRNMEKALAFYKAISFKTSVDEKNPPVVFFGNHGTKLELYPLKNLAEDINAVNPPPLPPIGFNGITLAINVKSEKEVDVFMGKALACGAMPVKRPQKTFWGGYSGYFQDLDGYHWEVAYGPDWKFDENDMLIVE